MCNRFFKNLNAPAGDQTRDPLIESLALYHVPVKARLYRKAEYDIPNLYPVTYVMLCVVLRPQ